MKVLSQWLRRTAWFGVLACASGCYSELNPTTLDVPVVPVSDTSISQPIDLDVTSADVAAKEETFNATDAALKQTEIEIAATESALEAAKERQSALPTEVKNLQEAVSRLVHEIAVAENELATSEQAFSEAFGRAELRKKDARQSIAAKVVNEYEQTVADIRRAQQERNELRARIGARPDKQSEAQLQSLRIRQARGQAQQTFSRALAREFTQIETEVRLAESRFSSAKARLAELGEERKSAERLINRKQDDLAALHETIRTLPITVAKLRRDCDALAVLKTKQADDLRMVQVALRRKNELLAE